MFEKRVIELSKKLEGKKKTFYVLTHKKHVREVYFQNSKEAITFIKIKFRSTFKSLIYLLIQTKIILPFLKKVTLSETFGDAIFVGGQIKSFDVQNNIALSFPLKETDKKQFLDYKTFQKQTAKEGYSPKILHVDKTIPYSTEELLRQYTGGDDENVFKKLLSYYKLHTYKEKTLGNYITFLQKLLEKRNIKEPYLKKAFKRILKQYPKEKKLLLIKTHGDFSREQILEKKDTYVFTDWGSERNLIIRDLAKYFGSEETFMKNTQFKKLLQLYPQELKEHTHLYLALNEIYSVYLRNLFVGISQRRIENSLQEIEKHGKT